MLKVPTFSPIRLQKRLRIPLLLLALGAFAYQAESAATEVDFQGMVVDGKGMGVAGATVKLLESTLTATSDADGKFTLKGTVAIGIIRRAPLPGRGWIGFRNGTLTVEATGHVEVEALDPLGHRKLLQAGEGTQRVNLGKAGGPARIAWLRILSGGEMTSFRYVRSGNGIQGELLGGPGGQATRIARGGVAAKTAAGGYLLEAGATGFLPKRFLQSGPTQNNLMLALLPAAASLKERIQDFIGAGNTFRIAYVKPEATGSRKYLLHHVDFAEMAGDTLPQHAYADSRGPAASPYGANVPSWSPDGRTLAYETGFENVTTKDSRIYLQPLGGARVDGPAYPATNPRWWTDGKDTSLVWSTSGLADAWADSAAATLRQRVAGGALAGSPETLTKGGYNAGLSRDGRYLATAYQYALMLDRNSGVRHSLHVYPGHPKAADGSNTDSLQACNGSISADAAHGGRMLFLDFGVPDEPSYANIVSPKLYAQHRMILIGDFDSDAAGRITDFVDTPAAELAAENSWDDPEWSNLADFVVATNRDPDGDKSVPSAPKPTQPDIFLIKLSTHESLRVFHGVHQLLPAAWIGPAASAALSR